VPSTNSRQVRAAGSARGPDHDARRRSLASASAMGLMSPGAHQTFYGLGYYKNGAGLTRVSACLTFVLLPLGSARISR